MVGALVAFQLGRAAQVWASMARVLGSHSRLQHLAGTEATHSSMQPCSHLSR